MKKKIVLILATLMCISLCACGGNETVVEEGNVNDTIEEETIVETEEVAEDEEEIIELTAEEKYVRAKAFMKTGDLENALVFLKEIEAEIPEVTEWITICEKYIPYCGIWTSDNYLYDSAAYDNEKTKSVVAFVQIFIDCENSSVSADFNQLEMGKWFGEEYARLGHGERGIVVEDLSGKYYSSGDGTQYTDETTFDFSSGEYVKIVTPEPGNTAMKGTNITTATYIKSEKTIDDFNTINLINGGIELTNPCEILDNCWYDGGLNHDGKNKYTYRLSKDEQLAKEKFEQYISETLDLIESQGSYEIMEDGSVQFWTNSQNQNVDEACGSIYLSEDRQQFELVVEMAENIEISANKPKEPAIGMTEKEVLNSTWGEPDKKNIDKYEWGTHEQWVYEGLGYIYLEDGVVTSIQYR